VTEQGEAWGDFRGVYNPMHPLGTQEWPLTIPFYYSMEDAVSKRGSIRFRPVVTGKIRLSFDKYMRSDSVPLRRSRWKSHAVVTDISVVNCFYTKMLSILPALSQGHIHPLHRSAVFIQVFKRWLAVSIKWICIYLQQGHNVLNDLFTLAVRGDSVLWRGFYLYPKPSNLQAKSSSRNLMKILHSMQPARDTKSRFPLTQRHTQRQIMWNCRGI
jgi:hypothetical protein